MKKRLLFVAFLVILIMSLYFGVFYILSSLTPQISGSVVQTSTQEKLFKVETNNDVLELREALSNVYPSLTEKELPELLKSGKISSNKGTTTYNQYLRFDDTTSLQKVNVNFTKDGDGVKDYLQIYSGNNISKAIFEYEIEFGGGFESDIQSKQLEDIEDEDINILGRTFSVTATRIDTDNKKVEITLLAAPVVQIMKEKESRIFNINGKQYTVSVNIISDNENKREVQLKINDETTKALEEGETFQLKDGSLIGVDDIITSKATSDQVKIFLGPQKIILGDNYNDDAFTQGAKVNNKNLDNAFVKIKGTSTSSEFSLTSIKYRITSNDDLYLKESERLSEKLNAESLLTDAWDIKYGGLKKVDTSEIKFDPSGDTELNLKFTNKKDKVYTVPFVSKEGSSGTFKLGDNTKDLVYMEGANRTDFNIDQQDYFIVTSKSDRTGETHILKYNSIDTSSKTISFDDLVEGSKTATYIDNSTGVQLGHADLDVGGTTYRLFISNDATPRIVLDQNADGSINSGEAKITVKGGGVLDIGSTNNVTDNFTVTLTTASSDFDERSSDETITFTIEKRPETVGISSTFSGILLQSVSEHEYGMSDFGALFDFFDESGNDADTLTIEYPAEERTAEVFIIYKETRVEVTQEEVTKPVETLKSQEEQKPTPPVEEKPQAPEQQANPALTKKQNPSWSNYLIIIGIIIIIVLIALVAYSLLKGKPKKPKTTSNASYFVEKVVETKDALTTFIQDHARQGYTQDQIKKYLKNLGYVEKQIEDALSKFK